jgi:hypothetical protein
MWFLSLVLVFQLLSVSLASPIHTNKRGQDDDATTKRTSEWKVEDLNNEFKGIYWDHVFNGKGDCTILYNSPRKSPALKIRTSIFPSRVFQHQKQKSTSTSTRPTVVKSLMRKIHMGTQSSYANSLVAITKNGQHNSRSPFCQRAGVNCRKWQ